jgi:hypothetical protein
MFSLRAVNLIKKASIASRIVAGVPKIASPSIQRVFLSNKASYKQQVVTNEPAGNEIIENMNSRTNSVSNASPKRPQPSRNSVWMARLPSLLGKRKLYFPPSPSFKVSNLTMLFSLVALEDWETTSRMLFATLT